METKDLMTNDQNQQHAELRRAVKIETSYGPALFASFRGLADAGEHVALIFGDLDADPTPLVRIHSECLTGDVFSSGRCDCGEQLAEAQKTMSTLPTGIILYLRQEGRGIGLYNKLDAYALQDQGYDTFEANRLIGQPADGRSFKVAAQMLNALGVSGVRLLTNNPQKAFQLTAHGIDVVEIRETGVHVKKQNGGYLRTKALKAGHRIDLSKIGRHE